MVVKLLGIVHMFVNLAGGVSASQHVAGRRQILEATIKTRC